MPDGLDFDEGSACDCGTGTAFHALKRVNISGDDTLAIFGQGPVGASGTMFAKAMGARVIAQAYLLNCRDVDHILRQNCFKLIRCCGSG